MGHTKAGPFTNGAAPALSAGVMDILDSQYDNAMADAAVLYGNDVRAWAPNTSYLAGQAVVSPSGDVVIAKNTHTSAATFSGAGYSGNWVFSPTSNRPLLNRAVIFGTSIEALNGLGFDQVDPTSANLPMGRGWFHRFNAYAGQAFTVVYNAGVGGNTSAQMLARIQTDVLAYNADWVFVGGPTNDPATDIPASTTIANMTAIFDTLLAAGKKVVALNIPPSTSYNSTGRRQAVSTLNRWYRDLSRNEVVATSGRTLRGVNVVDAWTVLTDPSTGSPATGMAVQEGDGITYVHWTDAGALLVGQAVYKAIAPLITPHQHIGLGTLDPASVIGAPQFDGGGTGWQLKNSTNTTLSFAPDDSGWGYQAVLAMSGVNDASQRYMQYSEPVANGRFQAGDTIRATARFRWSGVTPVTVAAPFYPFIFLQSTITGGSLAPTTASSFTTPSSYFMVPAGIPASGEVVSVTTKTVLPATVQTVIVQLGFKGIGTGQVIVDRVAIENLSR